MNWNQIMNTAGWPTRADVDELDSKYPYFILAPLLSLETEHDEERRQWLKERVAICVGDRIALIRALGDNQVDFDNFYPDMKQPKLSTNDTIDAFLNRFGQDVNDKETDLLTRMIFDSGARGMTPDNIGMELPHTTIHAPEPTPTPTPESKPAPKGSQLKESLAKVMIKNGNYTKALEIISELNLANPGKSVYFADQIRFLKKLIINQEKTKSASRE